MKEPTVIAGSPESFGWQRRPDLDTPTGLAYEAPNGEFQLFEKGRIPQLIKYERDANESLQGPGWPA